MDALTCTLPSIKRTDKIVKVKSEVTKETTQRKLRPMPSAERKPSHQGIRLPWLVDQSRSNKPSNSMPPVKKDEDGEKKQKVAGGKRRIVVEGSDRIPDPGGRGD